MSGYVPTLLEVRANVDGTLTYFDLINGGNGLFLDEWEPSVIQEKGGGVFSDSPMSDGKSLVFERWDNAIENIKVKAKAQTGNAISLDLQDLFHLFQMAKAYSKTAWQTNPVYLAMQPAGQTNEQYAPIIIGRVPNLSNPVRQPWYKAFARGGAAIDNLPIIIERGHWLENVPGVGTAIEALARNTFNSRTYGNADFSGDDVPTTEDAVFVANKRNEANLTHIYVADGIVFGSNVIDTTGDNQLLPVTPAVNDAVYFGIQTSVTDSGPFSNLVFNIKTAGSGYTAVWEYWDGSSWSSLQPYDPSSGLKTTGVVAVAWNVKSDWATIAISVVTGYWVRLRVSAVTAPTPPVQLSGYRIYSTTWPYAEVKSGQVAGDIPALGKLLAQLRSSDRTNVTLLDVPATGMTVGIRKTSRGSSFTAYINASDEQNPSGITVSTPSPSVGTMAFVTDVEKPTGRAIQWGSIGGDTAQWNVLLNSTIANHYVGRFRLFLRLSQLSGSAGDISVLIRSAVVGINYIFETDSVYTSRGSGVEYIDFGEVEIPPHHNGSYNQIYFYVVGTNHTGGAITVRYVDLIFIPTDELAFDTYHLLEQPRVWGGTTGKLVVDNISKYNKSSSYIYDPVNDYAKENFVLSSLVGLTFPKNTTFRLWFFMRDDNSEENLPEILASIQLERNQRYLGLRATN